MSSPTRQILIEESYRLTLRTLSFFEYMFILGGFQQKHFGTVSSDTSSDVGLSIFNTVMAVLTFGL